MHKKGSMELSVNSIVILVIAVVVMGLILGFISSSFKKIKIPENTPVPSIPSNSEQITINSPYAINLGENTGFKVGVFNTNANELDLSVGKITISCTGLTDITYQYVPTKVKSGSYAFVEGLIKAKGVANDKYLCNLKIGAPSNLEKGFVLDVQ